MTLRSRNPMPTFSSVSLPKPKDWQAFERDARLLFEHSLNDPHTQNNGRAGQPQHGVDIFGRRNGLGGYVGVQCKGEDADYGSTVTETEWRLYCLKGVCSESPTVGRLSDVDRPAPGRTSLRFVRKPGGGCLPDARKRAGGLPNAKETPCCRDRSQKITSRCRSRPISLVLARYAPVSASALRATPKLPTFR
jgi:hypothetical protein